MPRWRATRLPPMSLTVNTSPTSKNLRPARREESVESRPTLLGLAPCGRTRAATAQRRPWGEQNARAVIPPRNRFRERSPELIRARPAGCDKSESEGVCALSGD
jgi:hypothetical protein